MEFYQNIYLYISAIGVKFLFLYLLFKKEKISFKNMVLTALIVLLILSPHIKWLLENDFITISYGLKEPEVSEAYLIT